MGSALCIVEIPASDSSANSDGEREKAGVTPCWTEAGFKYT